MSFDGYSARFEGFETVEDYCRADCENPDLSDDQKRLCVQGCLLTEAEHFPAMTTFPLPDGPSRDLLERCAHAYYRLRWARDDWRHMAPVHREAYYEVADAILAEIAASGYVIVRKRAIGDALSDAIMEATNQGWNDPDSAIWRRGMAAGHRTLGLAWPGDLDPVGGGE